MKEATTILIAALIAEVLFYSVGRHMTADAQSMVNSPLIEEVEMKKALFYNRKRGGKDKIKLFYVRVPVDESESGEGRRGERRSGGSYWRQPPLNPSEAYSPGTPFIQERRAPPYQQSKQKSKYRSKSKPGPEQTKTPCPYKLLAEDLIEKQSRQQDEYMEPQMPPPPLPPTTTTPPPTTTTPPPIYLPKHVPLPTQAPPTIFYQPFSSDGVVTLPQQAQDILRLQQQQQQLTPFKFETLPQSQNIYQSSYSPAGDNLTPQYQYLLDTNNGLVLQQQQPSSSVVQQHPQLISSVDPLGRSSTPYVINQPSQQSLLQDQLQQFGRITSATGQQYIFERQSTSNSPQITLGNAHSPTFPNQSPQQQQVILVDKSQVAPTTVILPSGQVVHTQSPPQQQQLQSSPAMVLLNAPGEHSARPTISYLPSTNVALNHRSTPLMLSQSTLPIVSSDLSNYLTPDQSSILLGGMGRKIKRIKSTPSLPLFLQSPQLSPEPELPAPVMVLHSGKKSRRPTSHNPKDRKRYVVISKKQLEQMKSKKGSRPQMNLPPPPDVVHIPFHETALPEQDEYMEYEDNDSSSYSYNPEGPLGFSGGSHQFQPSFQMPSLGETVSMALTPSSGDEESVGGESSLDSPNTLDRGTGGIIDNEDELSEE